MNGFATSGWRPLGFGLLLCGVVGCSGKPSDAPGEPAVAPAAAPGSVAVRSGRMDSPVAGTSGERTGAGPNSPREMVIPADDLSTDAVSIDAVSLAAWNELLKPDVSPEAWEAARQTLVDRPAEAESLLIRELASDDAYHRETAATLLGQSGVPSEKAQPRLLKCLNDDSPFVRANAAAALASVPEKAETVIPVLTGLLRDSNPQLRKMAAVNLGSFGVEAAREVETLASALDDKDEEIVLPVVQLLGRIGQKAEPAMPKLQQIAFEQEGEIRKAAETAIEQIRTSEIGKE